MYVIYWKESRDYEHNASQRMLANHEQELHRVETILYARMTIVRENCRESHFDIHQK